MTSFPCLLFNLAFLFVLASAKTCGVNKYNNVEARRVVGGRDADRGEFPWQVSLQVTPPHRKTVPHFCGGVIIDKQWVLTAAHCVINPMFVFAHPQFWKVRIGEHHLTQNEDSEKKIDVDFIFYHPEFRAYDNDIALFHLKTPIEFNDYVKPICLSEDDSQFLEKNCTATGWGKTDRYAKPSQILKAVGIKVFDNSVCNTAYNGRLRIPIRQWHVCAGELRGGKGTCMGDSGGPLACKVSETGAWHLLGLTSFGSGCAKPGFPDVYTRVSHYIKWIKEKQAHFP